MVGRVKGGERRAVLAVAVLAGGSAADGGWQRVPSLLASKARLEGTKTSRRVRQLVMGVPYASLVAGGSRLANAGGVGRGAGDGGRRRMQLRTRFQHPFSLVEGKAAGARERWSEEARR